MNQIKPIAVASSRWAFWLLLNRSSRNVLRDPLLLVAHLLVTGVIAAAIAIFARDLPMDFVGVQTRAFLFNFLVLYLAMVATSAIGAMIRERNVFVRERTAHFYPTWCYCGTKFLCDLVPLRTLPTFVLAYATYWAVGLRDRDEAFCKFMISLLFANYTAATSSIFFSAICNNVGTANLFAAAYIIYSFIFSGMLLTGGAEESLVIRFTSMFFYPWEAMCGAEFAQVGTEVRNFNFNPKIGGKYVIPGPTHGLLTTTEALLDNFNLHDRFGFDIACLGCLCAFFAVMTTVILNFSKFAK